LLPCKMPKFDPFSQPPITDPMPILNLAFLTISLFIIAATNLGAQSKPNIIIVMVDDMGFAGPSISPYSNLYYETPGMNRLAREGMRFTDFHSSGSVCSPTRAGLLTGRYQQRAGIEAVIHPYPGHPEHRKGLRKSETTFAELFQQSGYATGIVGKWHMGYPEGDSEFHPQNHGFDYFRGYHSGNIDYINHWGDHYEHDWWHGRVETIEEGYTTHLINRYALEFIEENQDRPFCLYVAHESPHDPVQGPDDPIQRGPGRKERMTPQDEAMKQMMLEMDKGVEQIRSCIVSLGLEKKTLILFFSDNGDAPSTKTGSPNLRGHKGSLYEGGHRVPAIAWWPGKIPANTVSDALSISIDIMPTILSIAGIEKPDSLSLDGIDLSPAFFDSSTVLTNRTLFWAAMGNNGQRSEAVRNGPWKLVVGHPGAPEGTRENETAELYNLDQDLAESTDLAEQMPDRVDTMLAALHAWLADTERGSTPQPGSWLETNATGKEMNDAFFRFRDEKQRMYDTQLGQN
jgi:arylsulfatase A